MPQHLKVTEEEVVNLCARKGTSTAAQLLVLSTLTGRSLEETTEVYEEAMELVQKTYYKLLRRE